MTVYSSFKELRKFPCGKAVTMELSDEQKRNFAEIFMWRARFLFGILLQDIINHIDISQREIGRQAKQYRKYLKEKKFNYPKGGIGSVDQSGLSRIISMERPPNYGQIYIFMIILQRNLDEDTFPKDLQIDLWRLALFGIPEEIYAAYNRHKHMIDEDSPEFIEAYEKHKKMMEE